MFVERGASTGGVNTVKVIMGDCIWKEIEGGFQCEFCGFKYPKKVNRNCDFGKEIPKKKEPETRVLKVDDPRAKLIAEFERRQAILAKEKKTGCGKCGKKK